MSNYHTRLAAMGAAPVVQMRRVPPSALASVDGDEPKTVEDAERILIRANAELETFPLVRQMFEERLEVGTITQDEFDAWSVRHDRSHVAAAARCRRIQVWHDGLLRQRERQLMHEHASMGVPQLRAELERAKRTILTQSDQLASQGRRMRNQADELTRRTADWTHAQRGKLLRQLERRTHEIVYVLHEVEASGVSLHPWLHAFLTHLEREGQHYLSREQFLKEEAPGFRAHIERVLQTLAEAGGAPADDGTDGGP